MRLWSLCPGMLDAKGLLACWREAKLALAVLEGKTKGYKNHPQLVRFKNTTDPVLYIKQYLYWLHQESVIRGYHFDCTCIIRPHDDFKIKVTDKQLLFEYKHLKKKLHIRSPNLIVKPLALHPLFTVVEGEIELWEKVS